MVLLIDNGLSPDPLHVGCPFAESRPMCLTMLERESKSLTTLRYHQLVMRIMGNKITQGCSVPILSLKLWAL